MTKKHSKLKKALALASVCLILSGCNKFETTENLDVNNLEKKIIVFIKKDCPDCKEIRSELNDYIKNNMKKVKDAETVIVDADSELGKNLQKKLVVPNVPCAILVKSKISDSNNEKNKEKDVRYRYIRYNLTTKIGKKVKFLKENLKRLYDIDLNLNGIDEKK